MIYKPKFNLKDTVYIDRKFSSLSSSFFKPIVATSLLFLLPSLGMGDESTGNTYDVTGTGPKISVTTSEDTQSENLSWDSACSGSNLSSCTGSSSTSAITWSSNDNTWAGTYGSSSTAITSLKLVFDNADTSFVYLNTSDKSVSVNGAGNSTSAVSANFEGKNLGTSDNKINLEISFKKDLSSAKSVTISNLDTLYGNLAIGGGAMSSTATENQYAYSVTLGTLNGDLTLWGNNYTLAGTVTIQKSLVGSIYLSSNSSPGTGSNSSTTSDTAALTVNFASGATMTGDIADRSNGYGGIRKDIKFEGSSKVLTGNIVSFGTSSITNDNFNTSTGNRIYFTQGSMEGYIIASTGQGSTTSGSSTTTNTNKKGLNVVIFGDTASTTTHTLTGGILASDIAVVSSSTDTETKQATNVIVLADSTTLNIKANSSDTAVSKFAGDQVVGGDDGSSTSSVGFSVTSGSIVARNFGVNEIRIYKDSTLNLNNGSGSIKSYISGAGSTTTITNGSALNKINFLSENGVIKGSIIADNSNNGSGSNKASALIYVANNALVLEPLL